MTMIDASDFDDLREYPVAVLGPLLESYFAALQKRFEQTRAPTIGFVSREGVFLHRAFQAFCQARQLQTPSVHIPASRAFLVKLLLDDGSMDHVLKSRFQGTLSDLLADRAAILDWGSLPDVARWAETHVDLPRDADMVRAAWKKFGHQLVPDLAVKKSAYRQFLSDAGFEAGSIVADVGYSGSLQALLAWIIEGEVHSFYIATTKTQRTYDRPLPGRFEALFPAIGAHGEGPPLMDNSLLLEVMMSADHGQVDDYVRRTGETDWTFQHGPKGLSQHGHVIIDVMQDSVIDYLTRTHQPSLDDLTSESRRLWLFQYVDRMMRLTAMAPRLLIAVGDADDRVSGGGFLNPWRDLPTFA